MKKKYFVFVAFAVWACFFVNCNDKDDDVVEVEPVDTTGNQGDDIVDSLAGLTFLWNEEFPYDNSGFGWWVGTDVLAFQFEKLIHSMELQLDGEKQVTFLESITKEYTSAYRYLGVTDTDELARVPFYYPENWMRFDTVYQVVSRDTMYAHYLGSYPEIVFKINANIHNMNAGARPDFNYDFFKWDKTLDYKGVFLSEDALVCSFPFYWNDIVDTINRNFVRVTR